MRSVPHWLCGTVPYHSCGNCKHGFHGDSAVGIRILCMQSHHRATGGGFLMPKDGEQCKDFFGKAPAAPEGKP
jgi:hypothetical protein